MELNTYLYTIIQRPYVFLFLLSFLLISYLKQGWLRSFIFLFSGYFIAWASEASSIRNGFPYGWYHYIYENLEGEWLNFGVPVWDSVSYSFLCFAALSVSVKILGSSLASFKNILKLSLLTAFLTTLLDVIIDPVAHLGEQWFLGKIYYYPNPGFYFDVPLSNFLGWLLTCFAIVFFNLMIFRYLLKDSSLFFRISKIQILQNYGGVLLYFSVFLFNWFVALYLKQWLLAFCDLLWISLPVFFCSKKNFFALKNLRQKS